MQSGSMKKQIQILDSIYVIITALCRENSKGANENFLINMKCFIIVIKN